MTSSGNSTFVLFEQAKVKIIFLFAAILACILPAASYANPDVYSVLPEDTRILQYSLADFNGDDSEELAVLYTTAGDTRLTLFKADSGHWSRWWDDNGTINSQDGIAPQSLETVDTNGDGKAEVLIYYLTEKKAAMAARIMAFDDQGLTNPAFNVILEDMTAPPGYPVLGTEGTAFSVTFMRMATKEDDGYRRVYCWDGEIFEKCKEVVWEKP